MSFPPDVDTSLSEPLYSFVSDCEHTGTKGGFNSRKCEDIKICIISQLSVFRYQILIVRKHYSNMCDDYHQSFPVGIYVLKMCHQLVLLLHSAVSSSG